jgi:uroporphyrinogen decarboxylase
MNSRERVKMALGHKQPDKVPLSLGTSIVDGFTTFAKDNYEKHLGLETSQSVITHKPMGTVVTPDIIMDMYETDFRTIRLKAPWNNPAIVYEDGSYLDDYGVVMGPSKYYYDPVKRPLEGFITKDDICKGSWPDPYAQGRTEGLRKEAKHLYENTEYAVVADIMCGGPFEQAIWMRGFEDFLCDLYTEPELAEALMDKITEIDIGLWDVFLTEVGDYVDIVCQGDDLAMQDRAFIPLDMYNKHIKKYHKRIYDFIKTKTKAKIFHHCCGSVYELIPGLIDAGVDILNPIQTSAANMEPERLKNNFGKDLIFWGGIDTQKILPFGTPQEVEDEVKRVIEIMAKDGGYVIAPGHNIQALVPVENIESMLKAALKYR